jgi:hypothetical protein
MYRYSYERTEDGVTFGEPEPVEIEYKPVEKRVQFVKADDEKRLVYGIVLEPDTVDHQKDVAPADEIEKACHAFMIRKQQLDLNHQRYVDWGEATIVESYIAPQDLEYEGGGTVKKGSWVMVTKVFSDELWGAVKGGALTGYSIRGTGVRTPREA